MSRRNQAAAWLLVVAAGCALLVLAVQHVFVMTPRGQLVDAAAYEGSHIGRQRIIEPVHEVLNVVSVGALAAAGLIAASVALLRRRLPLAALALGTVVGSNVTTQLLKTRLFDRPDLGVTKGMAANTLPSGHTTVAMSVAAVAVLVAPARLRGAVALAAAAYGAATGVATLSAGYHRPSDAVAACLVVGAWAAGLAALSVVVAPRAGADAIDDRSDDPINDRIDDRGGEPVTDPGHPVVAGLLGGGAAVLLGGGAAATYVTAGSLPADLDRAQLLLAYGGGAALIAGTALAVVAALVVVAHRIAPARPRRPGAATPILQRLRG